MRVFHVYVVVSVVLLSACGAAIRAQGPTTAGSAVPGDSSVLPVDKTANGTQIMVAVGQLFQVTLDENITTGYSWAIESQGDPACKLVNDAHQEPAALPSGGAPVVGRSGVRLLLFQANQVGTGEIRLGYRRPWETNVPPVETFDLKVQVNAAVPGQESVLKIDKTADGARKFMTPGQLFEVVLDENRTTGYSWAIDSDGAPACGLIDDASVSGSGLPGAGGYRLLLFRTKQAGTGEIRLSYRRPWETGVAPIQTFTLKVQGVAPAQAMSFVSRVVIGDMNGDGKVDVADAVRVLRIALGLVPN